MLRVPVIQSILLFGGGIAVCCGHLATGLVSGVLGLTWMIRETVLHRRLVAGLFMAMGLIAREYRR